MLDVLWNFLSTLGAYIAGTVVSALVLGFMVDKFVIKKIMKNKDVQDIVKLIREAKDELSEHNSNGKN